MGPHAFVPGHDSSSKGPCPAHCSFRRQAQNLYLISPYCQNRSNRHQLKGTYRWYSFIEKKQYVKLIAINTTTKILQTGDTEALDECHNSTNIFF
jgi:hypothetical protein